MLVHACGRCARVLIITVQDIFTVIRVDWKSAGPFNTLIEGSGVAVITFFRAAAALLPRRVLDGASKCLRITDVLGARIVVRAVEV